MYFDHHGKAVDYFSCERVGSRRFNQREVKGSWKSPRLPHILTFSIIDLVYAFLDSTVQMYSWARRASGTFAAPNDFGESRTAQYLGIQSKVGITQPLLCFKVKVEGVEK